ncbi:MAG: toll/interleukin-1 receptor domain-containing protein [Acidimicrobiales bacterium]
MATDKLDFVLKQFGFRIEDPWTGSMLAYVRHIVAHNGDDSNVEALDRYLSGHAGSGEEPWEEGLFRLFITHIAARKKVAHELKSKLLFYGIDGFVAHDDIEPGREWQRVIESTLRSCHALVALLHTGIKGSNWCDQEIGMAHGRGVPIVPMSIDLHPTDSLGPFRRFKEPGWSRLTSPASSSSSSCARSGLAARLPRRSLTSW